MGVPEKACSKQPTVPDIFEDREANLVDYFIVVSSVLPPEEEEKRRQVLADGNDARESCSESHEEAKHEGAESDSVPSIVGTEASSNLSVDDTSDHGDSREQNGRRWLWGINFPDRSWRNVDGVGIVKKYLRRKLMKEKECETIPGQQLRCADGVKETGGEIGSAPSRIPSSIVVNSADKPEATQEALETTGVKQSKSCFVEITDNTKSAIFSHPTLEERGNDDKNLSKPEQKVRQFPLNPPPEVETIEETDITKLIRFQAAVTARYPQQDIPTKPLNHMISQFCHPFPEDIQISTEYQMPTVHHFILTDDQNRRMYGTCLTVWEEYSPILASENTSKLWQYCNQETVLGASDEVEISICDDNCQKSLYLPKVLCILSPWPYLSSFRQYLTQLYRLATSSNLMPAPIERYIINICHEVPAPLPGIYETRVDLGLGQDVCFSAPPHYQPVPWVALPFGTLFECLDTDNVLFVWFALTLEHKVILVSSQMSLLCVCAEVLHSLLFPMRYCHAYVPLLPDYLAPMLGAPMPYFCGVARCVYERARDDLHICDDAIIVDLDRNSVMTGSTTPTIPQIPERRLKKLNDALQSSGCRDAFWQVRSFSSEEEFSQLCEKLGLEKARSEAQKCWAEKLKRYDDAYGAVTPDWPGLFHDSREEEGHNWERVQDAFVMYYASVLMNYKKFILRHDLLGGHPSNSKSYVWSLGGKSFMLAIFISSQDQEYQPFLKEFSCTQHFAEFIHKRMQDQNAPEVLFFDEVIEKKKNESMFRIKKVETPVLLDSKERESPIVLTAMPPNPAGLSCGGSAKMERYVYPVWPETLDASLFGTPRQLPIDVIKKFKKHEELERERLQAKIENSMPLENTKNIFGPPFSLARWHMSSNSTSSKLVASDLSFSAQSTSSFGEMRSKALKKLHKFTSRIKEKMNDTIAHSSNEIGSYDEMRSPSPFKKEQESEECSADSATACVMNETAVPVIDCKEGMLKNCLFNVDYYIPENLATIVECGEGSTGDDDIKTDNDSKRTYSCASF